MSYDPPFSGAIPSGIRSIILPYERVSPIYIPRRDLWLAASDSLGLRVTVIERDDPNSPVLDLTGGIGGPACTMLIYHDNVPVCRWGDYGAPYAPIGTVLWSGTGTIATDASGSFDFIVPVGTLAGFPRRCGWSVRLDWTDGSYSQLLSMGTLHITPNVQPAAPVPVALSTDDGDLIEVLGA